MKKRSSKTSGQAVELTKKQKRVPCIKEKI